MTTIMPISVNMPLPFQSVDGVSIVRYYGCGGVMRL